jgi:hypothetical protein
MSSGATLMTNFLIAAFSFNPRGKKDKIRGVFCNGYRRVPNNPFAWAWTPPAAHAVLAAGGTGMAYEWDPRRARRARLIRLAAAVALSASAITVPIAVLLAAAPI